MTHVQKETAVLLKEKGFDLETIYHYYEDEVTQTLHSSPHFSSFNWNCIDRISAPTLHEANTWLREVKGVHVYVTCTYGEWDFSIENAVNGESLHDTYYTFQTHDQALESGIIYALKHYVK
jgi:hypothetical protein